MDLTHITPEVLSGFIHVRKNLEKTGALEVSGCELFKAADFFYRGPTSENPIAIRYIGNLFEEQIVPLTERNIPPARVFVRKLQKDTRAYKVRDMLGQERQSFAYDLAQALAQQPQGEEGILDVTGQGNFFFLRGHIFTDLMINAYWKDGWMLHTYRVEDDLKSGYGIGFREPVGM